MAIRTYDILLDSYNSTMPEPIVGRQGDKNGAVTLHVTITDRGTAVDLTGQTVNLIAETAKGTAVVADNAGVTLTDAVNGKFDYAIPNALWSESGKITKAYFSLNDTDGQQTTYDLIFIVKKAIDTSQEKADDYIAVIDGTVRDLQSKVDAIYATYQAGDFYSKTESDSRFYSKAQTDDKDAATLASAKSYTDYQSGNFYNKSETDNKDSATLSNAKNYTDNSFKGVSSVPEAFTNLEAIKAKYPNGANGVMVAADNGHKYIWSNGTWTDAGVYQSQGIASNSVGKDEQQAVTMPGVFASPQPIDFDFNKGVASVNSGAFFNKEGAATGVLAHTFGIKSDLIAWIVFDNVSKQFKLNNLPTNDETVVGWIWNGNAFIYGAKTTINGLTSEKEALKEGTFATAFSTLPIVVDRDKGIIRFQTGFTIRTQDGANNVVKLESDGGTQPDELNIADNGSGSNWDWLWFDKDYQRIVFGSKNVIGEGYYAGYSINRGQSVLLNGTRNVITNNGVNIACLGDSLTEGVGTTKRYFEYWQDLLAADNMQANFTNLGVGATTVADTGWKPEDSFVKRYVQIPDSTDITTILGGANDFNFGSVLGEFNSTDATTFCGGLNTIIDGLRKKNPLMTIICMTPTKAYYENHNWDEWGNSQDLHLIDYVNAMKAVCQNKSVNCIDLYSNSGYNPIDENIRTVMSSDGLHPNAVGHEKIARYGYPVIRANVLKI